MHRLPERVAVVHGGLLDAGLLVVRVRGREIPSAATPARPDLTIVEAVGGPQTNAVPSKPRGAAKTRRRDERSTSMLGGGETHQSDAVGDERASLRALPARRLQQHTEHSFCLFQSEIHVPNRQQKTPSPPLIFFQPVPWPQPAVYFRKCRRRWPPRPSCRRLSKLSCQRLNPRLSQTPCRLPPWTSSGLHSSASSAIVITARTRPASGATTPSYACHAHQ